MAKIVSADAAARAMYFDFECCVGEAPSILGWSYLRDDGSEHCRQRVVERALWPAARVTVPFTDGAQRCQKRTLEGAVRRMCELAEEGDRLLVSWSAHDLLVIETWVEDESLVERVRARYMNALPTARQWLQNCMPDVELERTYGGKHKLAVYARLMGHTVPSKYGANVAAAGIKAMRGALADCGAFRLVHTDDRSAWKHLLGHNRIDCQLAGEVVRRAAVEYAEAKGVGPVCAHP